MKTKAVALSCTSLLTMYFTFAPGQTYAETSTMTFTETVPKVCGIKYIRDEGNGAVRFKDHTNIISSDTSFIPISNVGTDKNVKVRFDVTAVVANELEGESNIETSDVRIAYSTSNTSLITDDFANVYSGASSNHTLTTVTSGTKLFPIALVNKDVTSLVSESNVAVTATVHIECL